MPFITQGKTNWKFLLIIIVLAAVVVGFSWWLSKNIFIEGPLIKPTKPDEKYCEKDSDCVLNYTGSETCSSCLSDDYQCVSLEYYNKVLWPEWEKNHKGILCEGCPMVTDKLQCICEKSLCKKIVKDETADWKTYSNEEYGFEIKYPQDWTNSIGENDIIVKLKKVNCFFDIQAITKESYDDRENTVECYKEKTININGVSFERFPCPYTSNTSSVYSRYYFQKDSRYYLIKLLDSEIDAVNEAIKEGKEIPSFVDNCGDFFDQVLSTFRFLE